MSRVCLALLVDLSLNFEKLHREVEHPGRVQCLSCPAGFVLQAFCFADWIPRCASNVHFSLRKLHLHSFASSETHSSVQLESVPVVFPSRKALPVWTSSKPTTNAPTATNDEAEATDYAFLPFGAGSCLGGTNCA